MYFSCLCLLKVSFFNDDNSIINGRTFQISFYAFTNDESLIGHVLRHFRAFYSGGNAKLAILKFKMCCLFLPLDSCFVVCLTGLGRSTTF